MSNEQYSLKAANINVKKLVYFIRTLTVIVKCALSNHITPHAQNLGKFNKILRHAKSPW